MMRNNTMNNRYKKPKIKDYVYLFPINQNEFQVRIGENDFVYRLRGKSASHLSRILPYLNGNNTVSSIARKTKLKKIIVEELIEKIDTFIIDSTALSKTNLSGFKNQVQFFSLWSKEPVKMQQMLNDASICIIGNCSLGLEMVKSLIAAGFNTMYIIRDYRDFKTQKLSPLKIKASGFSINKRIKADLKKDFKNIDLIILCQSTFDPHFCEEVNSWVVENEKSLMLVRKNGVTEGIVGPLIVPFLTACYKCLDLRIKANLEFYDEYVSYQKFLKKIKKKKITPCLNIFDKLLSAIATIEIIKYFTGFEAPITYSRFLSVNQMNLEFELHDILKLPRCPVCGVHEETFQSPWLEPIESEEHEG
jgi:bacteriocin biosynthesis cyclodehydratase domain-containing protein